MTGPANGATAPGALDLPAFSLDVQALDLGAGIKAVGLEILETESREPVRGKPATYFWSAVFPLLSAGEPFVLDFFSHLDRVREFCAAHELSHRGLDAYQDGYKRYSFCAVCEFEDGWVTLLSESIWSSEVIRRVRPAAQSFDVHINRPQ